MPGPSRFSSLGARLVGSLFFLVFLAMGLFFTLVIVTAVLPPARPLGWPALIVLVPLLFVAAGIGGLVLVWRPAPPPRDAISAALERSSWARKPALPVAETAAGPVQLKPRQSPLARLVTLLVLAAFWNGITSVFVWQDIASFRSGHPATGLSLFFALFVLVGLGLVLGVLHAFLGLWNPRPHLTFSHGALRLGETVDVEWRFSGAPGRIRRLLLTFEGREEATYPHGKSSTTVRQVFRTLEVVDTTEPMAIAAGTARIAIPEGTMHSFGGFHNRVVWSLKVRGEIRAWPDVNEELEVAVLPLAAGGSR